MKDYKNLVVIAEMTAEDKQKLREIAGHDNRDMTHEIVQLIRERWNEIEFEYEDENNQGV